MSLFLVGADFRMLESFIRFLAGRECYFLLFEYRGGLNYGREMYVYRIKNAYAN